MSFEPSGQLELSTDPFDAVGPLIAGARSALRPLFHVAREQGIDLDARGLDPYNPAAETELWVKSERYRKQSAHYASLGPWGRRMMLQSAAIHVNLDFGGRPVRRWWAANVIAPHLVALFANSPMLAGEPSGYRSSRAEQWRRLDPSRTGVFSESEDPVADYTRFALAAKAFLASPEGEEVPTFRTHWERGAGLDAWQAHLTTLFPEVRPRGYLELRSMDALPPRWLAVPLVLCVGILYAPKALSEVARLLPDASWDRLSTAGRLGLGDEALRAEAEALFDLAFEGAAELGEDVVGAAALEEAQAFRHRFVARGEDPGHESHAGDPFEI
jgi:glutamate--cysteine ligase